ncbi:MAG: hypothetical protein ACKOFH_01705, partial [Chthoniobacterales bacterium]
MRACSAACSAEIEGVGEGDGEGVGVGDGALSGAIGAISAVHFDQLADCRVYAATCAGERAVANPDALTNPFTDSLDLRGASRRADP